VPEVKRRQRAADAGRYAALSPETNVVSLRTAHRQWADEGEGSAALVEEGRLGGDRVPRQPSAA
jgi:hypothetical protein